MKSLLYVCPSAHPSLSFLKIGWLVFFQIFYMMIANHDIQWLTKPDFWKKICSPNLFPTGVNQAQNEVFCYFLEFGSSVLFDIAYSDRLHQCLTSSRGKTHEKINLWPKLWPKSGARLSFLSFSQVWFISFSLNCIRW